MEAEREERIKYKKEEEEKHSKNHYAFKEMMEKYKKEAEEEKIQQMPNQNNPVDDVEENKSNISVDSEHQNSIETIKLSTYNTDENQSTPNSSSSSRKKIDFNELKDKIVDMKGESSFDQSCEDNRDSNSSRKESVDSIDRKNNIIGQMKKEVEEAEAEHKISSLTSQFDELE